MQDNDYRQRNMRKAREAWLALPPEERKRRSGVVRAFDGDPVAYYRRHYAGLTRGQLCNKDLRLYECLRRHGLLGEIPRKPRVSFPDPLAYYREHCTGMTSQQVATAEAQFYRYLQQNGLLGTIPFTTATPATAVDSARRDARRQEKVADMPPKPRLAEPAAPPRRRLPRLAAAPLECFRIIPE